MIVVDATVWVDYLTGALDETHEQPLQDVDSVTGPLHVDFEVGSALIRNEKRGLLQGTSAHELMTEFTILRFERAWDENDLQSAFGLLNNATYADAIYVAMANRLNCPIMTTDNRMIECARIHNVQVIDGREGAE